MFERTRFGFHSGRMFAGFKIADRAYAKGDNRKALLALRGGLEAGHAALKIKSSNINGEARAAVAEFLPKIEELYRMELLVQMPEGDRELLKSVMKSWTEMGVMTLAVHPTDQMIGMFDIAKRRLGIGTEALKIVYDGDHVPAPLRKLMQAFLSGTISQEETEKRLDECAATLEKWMPELFPGEHRSVQ